MQSAKFIAPPSDVWNRIVARLRDRPEGGFNFLKEQTVELAAGQTLIIDFNATKGGFAFLI